jgi:hypothetical protein
MPIARVTPKSTPSAARTSPVFFEPPVKNTYDGVAYTENPRVAPSAKRQPSDAPIGMAVVLAAESAADVDLFVPAPTPANAPNPNGADELLSGIARRAPYTELDPEPVRDRIPTPALN